MSLPKGRVLVSFQKEYGRNTVYICFVDYSGHRARGGGCHYTATYSVRLTPEKLFRLLEPVLERGPGNEPDLVSCDGCGATFYSDELTLDYRTFKFLCPACKRAKQAEKMNPASAGGR